MTLYVVSTPIGNLEDITLRAIRVLREVDLVAAEDTRQTRKLLAHYGIATETTSYHEHNEAGKTPVLVGRLLRGEDVALVSDAGTPAISDPGYRLVKAAVAEGVEVVPVPGPSAITAAMSVAGLPTSEFTFKGFVPATAGKRKKFFLAMRGPGPGTFVMYESPKRLRKTLECISEVLGEVELSVAREMTKIHEEHIRGGVEDVLSGLDERFGEGDVKGEVTVVVRTIGAEPAGDPLDEVAHLLEEGYPVKEVASAVAAEFGITRKEAYRMALRIKEGKKG